MRTPVKINDNLLLTFTIDEFGYQEVLEDFQNARRISILTYSLPSKSSYDPISKVHNLKPDAGRRIEIIANIPDKDDKTARRAYFRMLDPRTFQPKVDTYFNFANHSKIVMTENVGYVGSANFTYGTTMRFECGLLIRDVKVLEDIYRDIFSMLRDNSVLFVGTHAAEAAALLARAAHLAGSLGERLREGYDREIETDIRELCEDAEHLAGAGALQKGVREALRVIDLTPISVIRGLIEDRALRDWRDGDELSEAQSNLDDLLQGSIGDDTDRLARIAGEQAAEHIDQLQDAAAPSLAALRQQLQLLGDGLAKSLKAIPKELTEPKTNTSL
jgi:hypothetical protein